ncbi:MAG: hypothetical protein ACK5NG_11745 [Chthoniobacterales bacterium]
MDLPSGSSVFPEIREKYIEEATPFGSQKQPGWYPDRLIPETVTSADPEINTQFWFTLSIPRDTSAGIHKSNLQLKIRELPEINIPIELTVFDFTLPKQPSLQNTSWISPKALGNDWKGDKLKALYRDVALHYQSADPILPQPSDQI